MQIWWKAHKDGVVIKYSRQPEASSVAALIHIPFVHLQSSQRALGGWRTGESHGSITVLNGPFPVSPCGNWGLQRGNNVLWNETTDQRGSHLLPISAGIWSIPAPSPWCTSSFCHLLVSSSRTVVLYLFLIHSFCIPVVLVWAIWWRSPRSPCGTWLSVISLSWYQLLPH